MRRECRERFPRHRLQREPLVSDPFMHYATCVTHVPWCMSGSLTLGGGENVSGFPGACATRNFTYLVRGPYALQSKLSITGLRHFGCDFKINHPAVTGMFEALQADDYACNNTERHRAPTIIWSPNPNQWLMIRDSYFRIDEKRWSTNMLTVERVWVCWKNWENERKPKNCHMTHENSTYNAPVDLYLPIAFS